MAGEKLDLFKLHRDQYQARREPMLVEVPPIPYLAIIGRGEPGGPAFTDAVQGLYGVAFTIKMTRKFAGLGDYKVCPLEGLWWGEHLEGDFTHLPRDQWNYKLLIRVPELVQAEADLQPAQAALAKKGKAPAGQQVALGTIEEGLCAQVLHVGPYDDERPAIERMLELARQKGLAFAGAHHEIYLGDPRRTAPERLRTILRHPVRPIG